MTQAQTASIEYNIYTFDMPTSKQKGQTKWKLSATTADMNDALSKAEELLGSKKFQKVEVKKKFFDQKTNRTVDMSLKTLETKPPSNLGLYLILLGSILAGGVAFCITYFLSHTGQ